jgi:Sulfite exporter TauE/SafE
MLIAFPLSAKIIVGTDIFHAAALLWVAGFGHLVAGNVDLTAVGWLLLGSIPGVLVGSQISVGLPDRILRFALSGALMLSGIKLLEVPHANAIVVTGLIVGLGALGVWGLVQFRRRRHAAYGSQAPARKDLLVEHQQPKA